MFHAGQMQLNDNKKLRWKDDVSVTFIVWLFAHSSRIGH